jgi:hypothetical protein
MILVVETVGTKKEVKLTKGAMHLRAFSFSGAHPTAAYSADERPGDQAWSIIRARVCRSSSTVAVDLSGRPKNQT